MFTMVVVVAYLLVTCYLGWLGYKQTKTAADYLVAGRSAHPVVMALSYGATFISTSAIVGFGGVAGVMGMGLLWLTVLNIFVGIFIAFVFLGGPTRRMGHHLDAHTFPELIGKRYNSRFLQVFCGIVVFIFMPLYAMAVMVGAAEFLQQQFDIGFDVALLLFAVIVAGYVVAGGLKGVMLTDALQGAIMLAGMLVLLGVTYWRLGGATDAHQSLSDMAVPASLAAGGHQGWTSMPKFGWAAPGTAPADAAKFTMWWTLVSTIVMGVGIGVLAQPQLIVRFMTVKSRQSLNRAVVTGGVFILFMTGVAFVVGGLSNAYFAKQEAIVCKLVSDNVLLDPGAKGLDKLTLVADDAAEDVVKRSKRFVSYRLSDQPATAPLRYVLYTPAMKIERGETADVVRPGLIAIARTIGPGTTMKGNHDVIIPTYVAAALPHWFGVVFLLTLLSAAMSTMSSQFHTMGTAIGRDVIEGVSGRHSPKSILITRCGIIVGLIVALVLAKVMRGNIVALATSIFFGLCASSFLPAFVLGLFWRRATRTAAIASMLVGFSASLFWLLFVNVKVSDGLGICKALFHKSHLVPSTLSPTWTVVDPLIVALPLSLATAIIVSLLSKRMEPTWVRYCFGGPKPEAK